MRSQARGARPPKMATLKNELVDLGSRTAGVWDSEMALGTHISSGSGALVGRDREIAACDVLLGRASDHGGVLLLRGAAGVGKTALLEAARVRAEARGFRVLTTTGSEAETGFAFAGLQPLLLPVLDHTSELPDHLRDALLSALGMLDREVPALAMSAHGSARPISRLCSDDD